MVFEIIKKIKGNEYRYLVKGVREGKKVRHKFVKYLGPVNPKRQRKKSTGRKSLVFVRKLTPEEKHHLRHSKRSNIAFVKDRAKIILLSNEGKTAKEIAEKLQKDYAKILQIIKQFNQKDLEILKRKTSNGRPKTISGEETSYLTDAAVKSPKDAGLPYNNWTCSLLAKWFYEKYNKKISTEWVRVLLRRNRITFTMPKHKLLKANEKLKGAFKKN